MQGRTQFSSVRAIPGYHACHTSEFVCTRAGQGAVHLRPHVRSAPIKSCSQALNEWHCPPATGQKMICLQNAQKLRQSPFIFSTSNLTDLLPSIEHGAQRTCRSGHCTYLPRLMSSSRGNSALIDPPAH